MSVWIKIYDKEIVSEGSVSWYACAGLCAYVQQIKKAQQQMISPPFRSLQMPLFLLSFMHGAEGYAALFTISKTSSGPFCISDEVRK